MSDDRPDAADDQSDAAAGQQPDHADDQPDAATESTGPADDEQSAEKMSDEDRRGLGRNAHPTEWEAVGREAIADLLRNQRDDIERDVGEVLAAVEHNAAVDPVHVLHVRDAIEALERTVEERVVPVSRDKRPWERTVERIPDHRLRDALGLDREDVRRLEEQREGDESETEED